MKPTDFAPRAAFMDSILKGIDLIGIEIGSDNGSHAEALLNYCSVKHLTIVDTWENKEMRGYCRGRLETKGHKNRITLITETSHEAANRFSRQTLDFIYIDITHDYFTVKQSLEDWWGKLSSQGIIGYRNYAESNVELKRAVDEFVKEYAIKTEYSKYHNEIVLFK